MPTPLVVVPLLLTVFTNFGAIASIFPLLTVKLPALISIPVPPLIVPLLIISSPFWGW